jgi:hypothetical protein
VEDGNELLAADGGGSFGEELDDDLVGFHRGDL